MNDRYNVERISPISKIQMPPKIVNEKREEELEPEIDRVVLSKEAKEKQKEEKRCVNNLKSFREKMLISRSELAAKSGLSVSTINKIEQGKASPTLTTMRKILNGLGLSPKDRELVFPNL
ncbi:MAG: helix-turn-helix transcriptional regulator [bacterium]|nr:helix-turn-helix transcriptional regulator [bacterium]